MARNKRALKLWAVVFWLLVWQGAAMLVGQNFLLASPMESLIKFFELAATPDFWRAALFSLSRILLGFVLGFAAGAAAAALAARWKWVQDLIAPLWAVLRAIPVASFVIVALIWMPSRNLSVLIAFLIVFPLIYAATAGEIERIDPQMLEMARVFCMSGWKKLVYVYTLPVLRGLAPAGTAAMGMAWKSGVAAELISIPAGSIGERLYTAKVYLMTGELFAWTLLIVLLSAACARLLRAILKWMIRHLEGA